MGQVNLNIRVDEDTKKEFEELVTDFGLTMTTAFTLFAKAVIREREIPFRIYSCIPNNETVEAIKEGNAIIESGKSRFNSADDFLKELKE